MDSNITVYSISNNYIATKVTSISIDLFNDLKHFFKLRDESSRYIICVGLNHTAQGTSNTYLYNFYEILSGDFLPITKLDGIYHLDSNKIVEEWRDKWRDKWISINFQSDIFDQYKVSISSASDDTFKIVQQIAIVLQAIDNKTEKLNEEESQGIRKKIDEYLTIKRP